MAPENPGLEIAKAAAEGAGKESVNKIAQFFENLFPFWGRKKEAIDTYVSEIKQSALSPEAKMMAIANVKNTFRERQNQGAILDVAFSAISCEENVELPCLTDGSEEVTKQPCLTNNSEELILRLMDAGKFVSDKELQLLWGNVLAGELEHPGETPKHIVRILSELSKEYAQIFSNLCSLCVDILLDTGNELHLIGSDCMIDSQSTGDYLNQMKIEKDTLRGLSQLGLINFDEIMEYHSGPFDVDKFPYTHVVSEQTVLTVINDGKPFPMGSIRFTEAGRCIARFVPKRCSLQHMDAIKKRMEEKGIAVSDTPGIQVLAVSTDGLNPHYAYLRP